MGNSAAGQADARGLSVFIARHLPLFSINFLGLVAVRIWIQADLYDRYTSTDSGIITIVTNLLRALLILLILAIIARRGFSLKAQRTLSILSAVTMTAASALFLLESVYPSQVLIAAACVFAAFGIIWGGGMWMSFYVRLQPTEALLYAFLSLAASSFLGLFLGIVPENVALLVAILMPTLSCIAFQRAQALLDMREGPKTDTKPANASTPIYDTEPQSTFIRLLAGVALFNLALGIARGFPSGASIELPLAFQVLHQFGVVVLSLGVIGWTLVRQRSLKFSSLWNIAVTLIAAGVLALAVMSETLAPFGAMLIAAANTFSLGLLWYSCYDIARHSSWKPYVILGVGWVAHILPRELGRAAIWVAEPHTTLAVGLTTVIILLLAVSMALLLGDSIPHTRPLFADFRTSRSGIADSIATHTQVQHSEKVSEVRATQSEPAFDPLTQQLEQLKHHYFLTEREYEVVALLARGRSKTAIGEKLFLSENTVKTYVKNVYAKLNVHTKQELLDRIDEQSLD